MTKLKGSVLYFRPTRVLCCRLTISGQFLVIFVVFMQDCKLLDVTLILNKFLICLLLHRFIIQDSNLLFYDQRSSLTPPETKPTGWVCCHQGQINCCLSRAAISFDLSVTLIFTSVTNFLLYGSTHYYKLSAKLLIYSHAYMASFQKVYIELVLSLFFFVFLRFKIISCY